MKLVRLGLLWAITGAIFGVTPTSAPASSGQRFVRLREPHPDAYANAKANATRRYETWLARHASAAPPQASAVAPLVQPAPQGGTASPRASLFQGLDEQGLVGGGPFTGVTPPDTTGAAGESDYAEMVNSEIAVYAKTNLSTPLASAGEDQFTGGSSTCDGQVRWDEQAGRWEFASLDCGEIPGYSFGWSKTADPANLEGGWCTYHVETGTILYDYPKLGGDDEYLIVGVNRFDLSRPEREQYIGSRLLVIPKPPTGTISTCTSQATVTATMSEVEVPVFTPVPANVFGSSSTAYVVAADYPEPTPGKDLRLFTVTKGLLGPTVSEQEPPISVASYTFPAPVPQPGSADTLDSSDTRITQAVAVEDPTLHKVAVWTQHTVAPTTGGPSVVRWYELNPGASAPVQAGTIEAGGGNFAFNAAISPTSSGDRAAIHYDVGGSSMLIQARAQSRMPNMALGSMTGDVDLANSSAIDNDFSCPSVTEEQAPCRWGDYAGASPDPNNAEVVWGSSQVNGPLPSKPHTAQWTTHNFALTADSPPVASLSASTLSPAPGEAVHFDASASIDPDGGTIVSYEWAFGDGSPPVVGATASHSYASRGTYTVTLTVTDDKGLTDSAHKTIRVDTPPTASFVVGNASPVATAPVGFDASASSDPDGTIASYAWSFGDGSIGGGVTPAHTYAAAGQYTVKLTVADDGGLTASAERTITVSTPPPSSSTSLVQSLPKETPLEPFAVLAAKQNKKTGGVAITVHAPGAGVLQIGDSKAAKKARHGHKRPQALVKILRVTVTAGVVTVEVRPSAAASRLLSRKRAVTVRLLIVYTPNGGKAVKLTKTVVLKKIASKRGHRSSLPARR